MARAIAAIFALVILAFGAVYALQFGLASAGELHVIENESWTPDAGNVTILDESERFGAYYTNDTEVYDENETLQDRGTDYEWFESNGTVKALQGGGLDGDSNATISYEFRQTTETQRQLTALGGLIPRVLGIILPLMVFALFLILIR